MLYKDQELTEEQAMQELATRDSSISDLTAERDSLAERLQSMTDQAAKLREELQETKKLNFTLASRIPAPAGNPATDFFKEVLKSGH